MFFQRPGCTLDDFKAVVDWLHTNLTGPRGEDYEAYGMKDDLYYKTSKWGVSIMNGTLGVSVDGRCLRGNRRVEFMLRFS